MPLFEYFRKMKTDEFAGRGFQGIGEILTPKQGPFQSPSKKKGGKTKGKQSKMS